jgi:hypothetical protein
MQLVAVQVDHSSRVRDLIHVLCRPIAEEPGQATQRRLVLTTEDAEQFSGAVFYYVMQQSRGHDLWITHSPPHQP